MKKALESKESEKESSALLGGSKADGSAKGGALKAGPSLERQKSHKSAPNKGSEGLPGKMKSAGEWVNTSVRFLREARSELKKVKWPTKKELLASTAVVIVLVLIVSLYLGIVDFGLIKLVKGVIG
jgi:preprotein translocase subunit SecE